jgi:cytochrome c oxidase subunit 2
MRTHIMKDDAFDFILLCNKICGASHYNMQMPLTVTTGSEYEAWYAEQKKKPFQSPAGTPAEPVAPTATADSLAADTSAAVVLVDAVTATN